MIGAHDDGYPITPTGRQRLAGLGIDLEDLHAQPRVLTRACLDWTERRPHLAGSLGAALATRLFELDWIRRRPDTRAVQITELGRRQLRAQLAINL
jgi:hypothetical protein